MCQQHLNGLDLNPGLQSLQQGHPLLQAGFLKLSSPISHKPHLNSQISHKLLILSQHLGFVYLSFVNEIYGLNFLNMFSGNCIFAFQVQCQQSLRFYHLSVLQKH